MFINYYHCYRCHSAWNSTWSAQCDDDCPSCGARHCSPYESEDADSNGESGESVDTAAGLLRAMRDAIEEAHDTHIYAPGDPHPADCYYCRLIARTDKLLVSS